MRLNDTSLCACPINGYFDTFIAGNSSTYDCIACPAPCQTCTSTSSCSTCYTNTTNVRLNDTSLCACPANGYYDIFVSGNVSTYDCVACPAACVTCASAGYCNTCIPNSMNLRLAGSGICACPAGYYDPLVTGNPSTYDCVPCPPKC